MSSPPVLKPVHGQTGHDEPVYRDIAVVLTQTPGEETSLNVAASLARRFGGELEVLQVLAMPAPVTDAWALMPDPDLMARYARIREAAAKRTVDLDGRMKSLGVTGRVHVLEALFDSPPDVAAAGARRTDLAVISRPANAPADAALVHRYFAGLLLESGRPVLVVPTTCDVALPPRHAVVAWSETRECARAVHDALPLLEAAEVVDIVMVDPVPTGFEGADAFGTSLAAHLSRHGVATRIVTDKSRGRPVSRIILDRASRARAQLIVAGGYGHSRLREWALGGTTRELFLDSAIPVLFAH